MEGSGKGKSSGACLLNSALMGLIYNDMVGGGVYVLQATDDLCWRWASQLAGTLSICWCATILYLAINVSDIYPWAFKPRHSIYSRVRARWAAVQSRDRHGASRWPTPTKQYNIVTY